MGSTATRAAPGFFIPNEEEWYKAAYYDPTLAGGLGRYHIDATGSDTAPSNQIADSGKPDLSNLANYILDAAGDYCVTQDSSGDPSQNYLTNVGAFPGSGIFYGTFDQNGSLWEIIQTVTGSSPNCVLRRGAWTSLASSLKILLGQRLAQILDIVDRLLLTGHAPERNRWIHPVVGAHAVRPDQETHLHQ